MLNEATATIFGTITKAEFVDGERPYIRMTIPVTNSWKDNDGKLVEDTHWYEVVAFGKRAETFKTLNVEGRYVRINADMTVKFSEIAGKKIPQINLIVQDLQMLDKKPN